jgi:Sigma-70, region 4
MVIADSDIVIADSGIMIAAGPLIGSQLRRAEVSILEAFSMAATSLLMRKLRDILRLKYEAGLSHRAIARACSIGVSTVSVHLQRAIAAGVRWPLPADLDDAALEAQLFASPGVIPAGPRPLPDWRAVHLELKRPSVTLRLLWLEHRDTYPTGYGYSQFCDLSLANT